MKMNKKTLAEKHSSQIVNDLLKGISEKDHQRTENRMLLAAKIDDGMKAKGWNQTKFAEVMGKQPSEISKWLSGTHNFTSETLWDIEEKLGIELISIRQTASVIVKIAEYRTVVFAPATNYGVGFVSLLDAFLTRDYQRNLITKPLTKAYA